MGSSQQHYLWCPRLTTVPQLNSTRIYRKLLFSVSGSEDWGSWRLQTILVFCMDCFFSEKAGTGSREEIRKNILLPISLNTKNLSGDLSLFPWYRLKTNDKTTAKLIAVLTPVFHLARNIKINQLSLWLSTISFKKKQVTAFND